MAEALASLPADCNREYARRLFVIAEVAFLVAHINLQKTKPDDGQ